MAVTELAQMVADKADPRIALLARSFLKCKGNLKKAAEDCGMTEDSARKLKSRHSVEFDKEIIKVIERRAAATETDIDFIRIGLAEIAVKAAQDKKYDAAVRALAELAKLSGAGIEEESTGAGPTGLIPGKGGSINFNLNIGRNDNDGKTVASVEVVPDAPNA